MTKLNLYVYIAPVTSLNAVIAIFQSKMGSELAKTPLAGSHVSFEVVFERCNRLISSLSLENVPKSVWTSLQL